MQREFEMVVQTSAATQSLRYLLKSGDMTCITKGEITKRLEAAVLLQDLSFQAVMTSGEVVEDMLENTYEDYDEALRDSIQTQGIVFKDYTFAVTYKYDEEAVFKPFFSRQYGADLGFSLPLVDDMKYANMCVCLALIKLSREYVRTSVGITHDYTDVKPSIHLTFKPGIFIPKLLTEKPYTEMTFNAVYAAIYKLRAAIRFFSYDHTEEAYKKWITLIEEMSTRPYDGILDDLDELDYVPSQKEELYVYEDKVNGGGTVQCLNNSFYALILWAAILTKVMNEQFLYETNYPDMNLWDY